MEVKESLTNIIRFYRQHLEQTHRNIVFTKQELSKTIHSKLERVYDDGIACIDITFKE